MPFWGMLMIDTVKLKSPYLGVHQAAAIEQECMRRQAVFVSTGELQYSITTGSLDGSFDERVSVRVDTEDVPVKDRKGRITGTEALPFVLVEGSVHKALLGHNVEGGPCEPVSAITWLLHDIAGRLWSDLPPAARWIVQRVDVAEVYALPCPGAVTEYVHALNLATFPRRCPRRYGDESIFFPGTTTSVKAYHKGPEFKAHDAKRLRGVWPLDDVVALHVRADCLLRWEVSILSKTLRKDFDGEPTVSKLTQDYIEAIHDKETNKIIKLGKEEMELVRTHREVSARLEAVYGRRLATSLFGTWVQLAVLGEAVVKQQSSKPTFYRQRKQLVDAAVSWAGADVIERPSALLVPAGFSPVRSSPFRLVAEDLTVTERLAPFRRAA